MKEAGREKKEIGRDRKINQGKNIKRKENGAGTNEEEKKIS